jgi:Lrp/AsnC family leucine-responsive transcriptional regulator
MIDVRLRPETKREHFEAQAARLPCVEEVAFVTGRADYHVRVSCRDADELDQVVRALRQRGGVATAETRIVMRTAAMGRQPDVAA